MFSVGYGGCSVPGCTCGPDPNPWSYTVGRVERGQPEFVVLGLDPSSALRLAEWADARWPILAERPLRLDGHLVRIDRLGSEWVGCDPGRIGNWFAYYEFAERGHMAPAMAQVVWADHWDRFPDDAECDRFVVECQPLLSVDPLSYPAPEPGRAAPRARRRAR